MLYLFPNVLSEEQSHELFFPKSVDAHVTEIEGLIAESEKSARSFLKRFSFTRDRTFRDIPIKLLNEHTTEQELKELIALLMQKGPWGLISDCGLPCLADPGARLVALAHKRKISVKTFPGPSSIVMALMLSGLVVQSFTFHGYLPRELPQLQEALASIEKEVIQKKRVQVFIEAPYRSEKLLHTLRETLAPDLLLSLACDLTLPTEEVLLLSIAEWRKKDLSSLNKRPSVFLVGPK
ncbi:MAG: SAM-dependent methyltransferase [Chlamydiae bacterium]|nr:SAM-dependent methyltransferase [Chlamydiota bacterium]